MNNLNRIIRFKFDNHKVKFDPATNKGIVTLPDDSIVSFILIDYEKIQPISELNNSIQSEIGKRLDNIFRKENYPDYFTIDLSKVKTIQDKAIVYAGFANGLVFKFEIDAAGNIQSFIKRFGDDSVWKKRECEFYWNGFMICHKRNGLPITKNSQMNDLNKIMPEVMIRFYTAAVSIIREDIKRGIFK